MLLSHQPFYISGIDNVQEAKDSALGAMFCFVIAFGISIVLWWRDARIQHALSPRGGSDYNQVPLHAIDEYEFHDATNTFLEEPSPILRVAGTSSSSSSSAGGSVQQRRRRRKEHDDNDDFLHEEELESSSVPPHVVPEGQLLPTTHV
jgi:hypothetical protein